MQKSDTKGQKLKLEAALSKLAQPAILLAVFFSGFVAAQDEEAIGTIVMTRGNVTATSQDGSSRALRRRSEIFAAETITTDATGFAQIRLVDSAIVALKENTEFLFEEYAFDGEGGQQDRAVMSLLQGGFRTIDGLITDDENGVYRVDTQYASIGVRGTAFSAVIDPELNALFTGVSEGGITVTNGEGAIDLGLGGNFDFSRTDAGQPPRGLRQIPVQLGVVTVAQNPNLANDDDEEEDDLANTALAQNAGDAGNDGDADEDLEETLNELSEELANNASLGSDSSGNAENTPGILIAQVVTGVTDSTTNPEGNSSTNVDVQINPANNARSANALAGDNGNTDAGNGNADNGNGSGNTDTGNGSTGNGNGNDKTDAGSGSGNVNTDAGNGNAGNGNGSGNTDIGNGNTGNGNGNTDAGNGNAGNGNGNTDAGNGNAGNSNGNTDTGSGNTDAGSGNGNGNTDTRNSSNNSGNTDTGSGTGSSDNVNGNSSGSDSTSGGGSSNGNGNTGGSVGNGSNSGSGSNGGNSGSGGGTGGNGNSVSSGGNNSNASAPDPEPAPEETANGGDGSKTIADSGNGNGNVNSNGNGNNGNNNNKGNGNNSSSTLEQSGEGVIRQLVSGITDTAAQVNVTDVAGETVLYAAITTSEAGGVESSASVGDLTVDWGYWSLPGLMDGSQKISGEKFQRVYLAVVDPANIDDLKSVSGNWSYSSVANQFTGSGTAGTLTGLDMGFDVDLNSGTVTNGSFNATVGYGAEHWSMNFSGSVNGATATMGDFTNDVVITPADMTQGIEGSLGGVFTSVGGTNGFVTGFSLTNDATALGGLGLLQGTPR